MATTSRHLGVIAAIVAASALAASASPAVSAPAVSPVWVRQALTDLALLDVHPQIAVKNFSRIRVREFGDWKDFDKDRCDTRQEILHRDLTGDVPRVACPLKRGRLKDPYTRTTIEFSSTDSRAVQIDHVVALKNAWQTGAKRWSREERVAFANDPRELLAVDGPANMQKGAKDASQWLPVTAFECAYVAAQVAIKKRYELWVTPREHDAMKEVLDRCGPNPRTLVVLTGRA